MATTTATTTTTTTTSAAVVAVVAAAFAADKARGKLASTLKPLFALPASELASELQAVFSAIGEKSKDEEQFSRVANSVAVYARQLNAALSTPLPLFYIGLNRAEKTAVVKVSEQVSAAIIKRELADDLRAQNKALASLQTAKAPKAAAPAGAAVPAPKVGLSNKHAPGTALGAVLEQINGWREGELQDLQRAIAELIASKAKARLEKAEKAGKVTAAAKTKASTAPEAQKRAKAKAKAKAEAVAVA